MEASLAVLSNFSIQTSNFLPRSPADGDQTGIHAIPALQSAASVTAVFSSVLYSQTSNLKCVLQRATFATVRHMRRRWHLSLSWMPNYRRLFSAKACSSKLATSLHRAVRNINITRRVLISPEETIRLRSSWLTGDLELNTLMCNYLILRTKRPNRPDPFDCPHSCRSGKHSLRCR